MSENIEALLKSREYVISPVKGDSMMPMLNQATDTVKLVAVNSKLKKGDLPLYRRENGQLVLHRIIKVRRNGYVVCGDNRCYPEYIPFDWVKGVVTGYFKNGKYISCDEKEYISYVKKRCRSRVFRRVKSAVFRRTVQKKDDRREWKYLITAVGAAINREPVPEPDSDINYGVLLKLASRHFVSALVFKTNRIKTPECPSETFDKWKERETIAVRRGILFGNERKIIVSELEKRSIPYIFLKGIILSGLYPSKMSREFTDNDILFDESRKAEVETFMTDLGYSKVEAVSSHDEYHKNPVYNFEMHKQLMPYVMEENRYFSTVWERAKRVSENSSEYVMSAEDCYIYTFAHFATHYKTKGTGLRSFADIYLLKKSISGSETDFEYIKSTLRELKLDGLEEHISDVCVKIFEKGGNGVKKSELEYIKSSGMLGKIENLYKNEAKRQGTLKYVFFSLFQPYRLMKLQYPILEKVPVILPFMWVYRLIKFIGNPKCFGKAVKAMLENNNKE